MIILIDAHGVHQLKLAQQLQRKSSYVNNVELSRTFNSDPHLDSCVSTTEFNCEMALLVAFASVRK